MQSDSLNLKDLNNMYSESKSVGKKPNSDYSYMLDLYNCWEVPKMSQYYHVYRTSLNCENIEMLLIPLLCLMIVNL